MSSSAINSRKEQLPTDNVPLSHFETYGWTPDDNLSEDENYIDLVLLITRSSQLKQGSMGCLLVQPSSRHDTSSPLSLQDRILVAATNQSFYKDNNNSDIHAEMVALARAARRGIAVDQCTAYITMPPCKRCLPALVVAGIGRIVSRHEDENRKGSAMAAACSHLEYGVVRDTTERLARINALVQAHKERLREDGE